MTNLSLRDIHDALISSTAFADRVHVAYLLVAREVLAEPATTHGNPLRVAVARATLNSGDGTSPSSAPNPRVATVATDPDVLAAAATGHTSSDPAGAERSVTDEDLMAAVRAAWDIAANVTPPTA
ncbi:hypothetical protein ACIP93_33385 [Streptomyces sp. NPDC088745]|uniref:hypothetical protein n=1 Tax=Streptomyces sp. NPDC088745 TaxID=3365884 RepID=UPI003821B33B